MKDFYSHYYLANVSSNRRAGIIVAEWQNLVLVRQANIFGSKILLYCEFFYFLKNSRSPVNMHLSRKVNL